MRNYSKSVLLGLLLLLFTGLAAAQPFISYSSTGNQTSCPCKQVSYKFYLKNTGASPETYRLEMEGELSRYSATTIPSGFRLSPGQETEFSLLIRAPCELYGRKRFNFIIHAEQGKSKAVYPLVYDIKPCYDYSVETGEAVRSLPPFYTQETFARQQKYSICENESRLIPVRVMNNAEFANRYYIKVIGDGHLSIKRLILNASRTAIIPLKIEIPKYAQKEFNISLSFVSEKGELRKQADITIQPVYCVTPIITFLGNESLSSGYNRTTFSAFISNRGNIRETYSVKVKGAEWVRPLSTGIGLEPGQGIELRLVSEPGQNIRTQIYKLQLDITAQSTGNTYSKPFTINLAGIPFYEKVADILEKPLSIFLKYLWIIIAAAIVLAIIIFLLGQYREYRKIESRRISQVKLRKIEPRPKLKKAAEPATLPVPIISPFTIFLVLIIIAVLGVAAITYLNIPERALNQTYGLNISLDLNVSLPANFSFITPGYNLTAVASREYLPLVFFIVAIILTALSVFFFARKRKGKIEQQLEELKPEEPAELREEAWPRMLVMALAAIGVLFVLAFLAFKFPLEITTFIQNTSETDVLEKPIIEQIEESEGALAIEQGSELRLNLSQYFYDPDNDKLYFNATTEDNLTAIIRNDTAILRPKRGFYGISYVIFTADDGKGGVTETGTIPVVVRRSERFSANFMENIVDFVSLYRYFFLLGLILLALLIAILYYRERKE